MNDQEKAREELQDRVHELRRYDTPPGAVVTNRALVDAVLSADPRVIAEAMGGRLRLITGVAARVEIVLPPRKVES